jgi:single-strand DNA-binding protein
MNLNRVTLVGHTGKNARTITLPNGRRMTRLSVATSKRFQAANGVWQQKTQWHHCVAYGSPIADEAAMIQTGTPVSIDGELSYRESQRTIETDSGPVKVPWPVTEIVISSLSILDRKDRQTRRGAT